VNLTLEGVGVTHANGHVALSDIDLRVEPAERVAIIGPSGAGKTTLLRLLATSLQPTSGAISLLEQLPWQIGTRQRQRLRARIGLIHQAPPLPPRQRVVTAILAGKLGEWPAFKSLLNLLYPVDISGAKAALARLDLADKLFERCDQLSGGQLQRVGIARVLYQSPQIILADEPVSAMDPVLAGHTLSVLSSEAAARGVTLLASLHAVDLAMAHFPRVIGVRAGRIVFDLPSEQISQAQLDALYANEQLQPEPSITVQTPTVIQIPRC